MFWPRFLPCVGNNNRTVVFSKPQLAADVFVQFQTFSEPFFFCFPPLTLFLWLPDNIPDILDFIVPLFPASAAAGQLTAVCWFCGRDLVERRDFGDRCITGERFHRNNRYNLKELNVQFKKKKLMFSDDGGKRKWSTFSTGTAKSHLIRDASAHEPSWNILSLKTFLTLCVCWTIPEEKLPDSRVAWLFTVDGNLYLLLSLGKKGEETD